MPHELFGERFISLREPAWHGLGIVSQEALSAREAWEKMGPYKVQAVPLFAMDTPLPYQALLGPSEEYFGVVSGDYTLITPEDFINLWDLRVKKPIETMGALRRGSILFISTKLEGFSIKGDDHDNYLLATNPMTGSDAAEVRVTPVRVVCMNTYVMSATLATERYRMIHTPDVLERMGDWMEDLIGRTERSVQAVKDALLIMAQARLKADQPEQILERVYAHKTPRLALQAPPEVVEERYERIESFNNRMDARRAGALELYDGKGTGSDYEAYKGTPYGLYNAVVELEDYRETSALDGGRFDSLWGKRADFKARAFQLCQAAALN